MKRQLILHPLLFALFPVLFIFSANIGQVLEFEILFPLIAAVVFTCAIWLLLGVLTKDIRRAGAITSVFSVIFFSYGHLHNIINTDSYLNTPVGKIWEGHLLFILCGIFLLSAYLIMHPHRNLYNLTRILNFVAIFLVAIQMFKFLVASFDSWQDNMNIERQLNLNNAKLRKLVNRPNIYYIILDGYARADTLRDFYGYDNAGFLQYLREKGFYVAEKSTSNYPQTLLSLASSLNFDYLDSYLSRVSQESNDRILLSGLIQNSKVISLLRKLGYKIIFFSSGYNLIRINNADIHIKSRFGFPEFLEELLRTTPIPYLFKTPPFLISGNELHRRRILFNLDYLDDVLKVRKPIFVFAHILCPHPPFIFDRNGNRINQEREFSNFDGPALIKEERLTPGEYEKEYLEQLMFVNLKIRAAIESILSKANAPMVIILQGDHGPGSMLDWDNAEKTNIRERFGILNAYYFSDRSYGQLYETVSPVNSFRIIFNHYLGTDFAILPDRSYFSSWDRPYKFIDVSGKTKAEPLDLKAGVPSPKQE